MTKIDSMNIKPLNHGFLLDVWNDGSDGPVEYALTSFQDLINTVTMLLAPVTTVGVDMAEPGSEMSADCIIVTARNGNSTLHPLPYDDGWRDWKGWSKGRDYPHGVDDDTIVAVRYRNKPGIIDSGRVKTFRWHWSKGRNDPVYDPALDIVAYRVVPA